MTYTEALAFLDGFANYERKPPAHYGRKTYSLRRMVELVRELGDPQERYQTVHVAGSKGKGSTAAMMAHVLRCAGKRVGLYTSPHLVRFGERIRIDGAEIEEEAFIDLVQEIQPALDAFREQGVTYFEALTAIALLHFARQEVDAAVLEVGLGGRLDATNVVRPACCCITTLDLEHTDRLGTNLVEIAREKAGVIKRGVPCVTTCLASARGTVIEDAARARGAPLRRLGIEFQLETRKDERPRGNSLVTVYGDEWKYSEMEIGLLGWHQRINAAGVVAMAELLKRQGIWIEEEAVREGLRSVSWPGRLQRIEGRPLVVMDCAHSKASALSLRSSVEELFGEKDRRIGLVGFLSDKDYRVFLEILGPLMDGWIVTEPNSPRARNAEEVADFLRGRQGQGATVDVRTRQDALDAARKEAGPGGLVLVTGSVYLVGEMLARGGTGE